MAVLVGACIGAVIGARMGAANDVRLLGGIAGFALGAVAGIGLPLSFVLIFSVVGGVGRLLSPPNTKCTCGWSPEADPRGPAGAKLISSLPHTHDSASTGSGLTERHRLADSLKGGASLNEVLQAGLPPKLIFAFSCGVAARALDVFEDEFHQALFGREVWNASRAVLDGNRNAAGSLKAMLTTFSPTTDAQCRVPKQSRWDHVLGRPTRGVIASFVLTRLRNLSLMFLEPTALWATHEENTMSDSYDSPEMRLSGAHPALLAKALADEALKMSADPVQETEWQRTFLRTLILGWESWDEDRAEWKARVTTEWVPRVRQELMRARFDVAKYADGLERALVTWERA